MGRRVLWCLVLLTTLLILGTVWYFAPDRRRADTVADTGQYSENRECCRKPASSEFKPPVAPDAALPRDIPPLGMSEPPQQHSDVPPELSLRFVDVAGKPVAALPFHYCLDDLENLQRVLQRTYTGEELEAQVLAFEGLSDAEGWYRVPSERVRTGLAAIRLAISDPRRAIVNAPPFSAQLTSGMTGYRLCSEKTEITVTVDDIGRLEIEIRYEDGSPFTGEVRTQFMKGRKQQGRFRSFRLEGSSLVNLDNVPKQVSIRVLCLSTVLGFEARSNFTFPPDAAGPLVCVIKKATGSQAGIRVEVQGVPTDESLRILVLSGEGMACGGEDRVGPGAYIWLEANPAQKYVVTARSERGNFQSDAITLKPGEITTVVAQLRKSVSYKVAVADQDGRRIWPASLSSNTLRYEDFVLARNLRGEAVCDQNDGRAFGDKSGQILLIGVASSATELLLSAEGYTPVLIRVRGNPGETVDLGVVRLVEAAGSVTVKLLNQVEGVAYRCILLQPFGPPVLQAGPKKDGDFKFTRVPLREYTVFVCVDSGLRGVSAFVALTEQSPSAVLQLDVTGCELRR